MLNNYFSTITATLAEYSITGFWIKGMGCLSIVYNTHTHTHITIYYISNNEGKSAWPDIYA